MAVIPAARADGKLLRGQKWQRFSCEESGADFYISPDGDDSWSGRLPEANAGRSDGPFATFARARRAVRELKRSVYRAKEKPIEKRWIGSPHPYGSGRDILVLVRGGRYYPENIILFESGDGGERIETGLPSGAFEYHKLRDHYVTYAAYPGELPVLCGGTAVRAWSGGDPVWSATLSEESARDLSLEQAVPALLAADGAAQVLARTPDRDYFTPARFPVNNRELPFRTGDLRSWPGLAGNRLVLLLRWHRGVNALERVDEEHGVAYLRQPQDGIVVVPPRYYVENVRELLDSPGEWFYDTGTRVLEFRPPEEINDPNRAAIVLPKLQQLLVVRGEPERPVRNLRFYGLCFEALNPGAHMVTFEYAHSCELVESVLRASAGAGVRIGRGCYATRILDNVFDGLGSGAVHIDGEANPGRGSDIIRQTLVSHNRIRGCGGINISARNALFTTISRNEISHTRGRHAISVGGWRNLEEAVDGGYRVLCNHLHHVQKDADDSGAIKTAGLTYDSVVRGNLIHDVAAGYFNDNVGFWFDNMSSGWLVERNIYYNLGQGEMKLCAANLTDNVYRDNFLISAPVHEPEVIIDGEPRFEFRDLRIDPLQVNGNGSIPTGTPIEVSAEVTNRGATGVLPVELYQNGVPVSTVLYPLVAGNSGTITFSTALLEPGVHYLAAGATVPQILTAAGEPVSLLYRDFTLSLPAAAFGETVTAAAVILNLEHREREIDVPLRLDGAVILSRRVVLPSNGTASVQFTFTPATGLHRVRIGDTPVRRLRVYSHAPVDLGRADWHTHVSATVGEHKIEMDPERNLFRIRADGSDFFHAEDSYAAAYLGRIEGDFSAKVKVSGFGPRTHEWFRAGLFVRNDMARSFDVSPGSPGSVLLFTTPARAGIQWDEFGDGCMHKAVSENLPEDVEFPLWLKLDRRGGLFTGAVSFDGKNWIRHYSTRSIPELGRSVDLGLAAGAPDRIAYEVMFQDLVVKVER